MVFVDAESSSQNSSSGYSIGKSSFKGWNKLSMAMGSEQDHTEMSINVRGLRDFAARYNLSLIPQIYFTSHNLAYAKLTFTKNGTFNYGKE